MEVAGLTISVAGLATLFDLCLKGFDLLEQGKDFSRDYIILRTRLNAQRAIFTIWGDAVGLLPGKDFNDVAFLFDSELRSLIKGHLDCISLIFEDASQLTKKYGLQPTPKNAHQSSAQMPLRSYLNWFQKQTSRRRKAKWVIRDLTKFKTMLDDLSKLITDLRDITSSVAEIKRQNGVFVAEEIATRDDIDDLGIIEEALSQENPALSSAASERRTVLTQTAFTARSLLDSSANRDEDDDMHTHADSDADAQMFEVNEASSDRPDEVEPEDREKTFEISAKYGHQNNLSEIQKADLTGITRIYPILRADPNPSTLSRMARLNIMKQLRDFRDNGSETPFISIGFADSEEGGYQLVGFSFHRFAIPLTFQNDLLGKFQAPVSNQLQQVICVSS